MVNKIFQWIAIILGALGGFILALTVFPWLSSGIPDDWFSYVFPIEADVFCLITPAVTIFLVLWINASRDARKVKEAHNVPHEAPLFIYEHDSQE